MTNQPEIEYNLKCKDRVESLTKSPGNVTGTGERGSAYQPHMLASCFIKIRAARESGFFVLEYYLCKAVTSSDTKNVISAQPRTAPISSPFRVFAVRR